MKERLSEKKVSFTSRLYLLQLKASVEKGH